MIAVTALPRRLSWQCGDIGRPRSVDAMRLLLCRDALLLVSDATAINGVPLLMRGAVAMRNACHVVLAMADGHSRRRDISALAAYVPSNIIAGDGRPDDAKRADDYAPECLRRKMPSAGVDDGAGSSTTLAYDGWRPAAAPAITCKPA